MGTYMLIAMFIGSSGTTSNFMAEYKTKVECLKAFVELKKELNKQPGKTYFKNDKGEIVFKSSGININGACFKTEK